MWLYQAWQALGCPLPVTLAEIGPGRGTLMKDMLRTLARLDPGFVAGAAFAMIEASPRLTEFQKATLAGAPAALSWHETIETLPAAPLLIVGNELFDAVPVRQFVRAQDGWRERMVGLDEQGVLRFFAGAASLDPALLPPGADTAAEGAVVEMAPARSALMERIAGRIARQGGAGLFIDYGYLRPGVGDTLQAVRRHEYEDMLASPGEADLTAHVDFPALAAAAHAQGLETRFLTQGAFLLAMGLLERAGRLGAAAARPNAKNCRPPSSGWPARRPWATCSRSWPCCRRAWRSPPLKGRIDFSGPHAPLSRLAGPAVPPTRLRLTKRLPGTKTQSCRLTSSPIRSGRPCLTRRGPGASAMAISPARAACPAAFTGA